jgi:prepilin-type N-terminal cleavage/methylation domain-containing protein
VGHERAANSGLEEADRKGVTLQMLTVNRRLETMSISTLIARARREQPLDGTLEEGAPSSTQRDKGFTLVELLIVIVILGILATVTVFAVRGITERGEESACDADRSTLESAAEAYYAQEGAYPANAQALVDGGFIRDVSDLWTYARIVPVADDPATPADETVEDDYTLTAVVGSAC